MAYKIAYSPESSRRYPQSNRKKNTNAGKFFVSLMILFAAVWLRYRGIPDFLIPGDPAVTRAAVSGFVEQVQAGVSVGEAITVFCQHIIAGGGY